LETDGASQPRAVIQIVDNLQTAAF